MQFAANYSEALVRLLKEGTAQLDVIKLPAWPHLIDDALALAPCYVHFPLNVGNGFGDAFNSEAKEKVNWDFIEDLLKRTNTPIVNVHLGPAKAYNQDVEDDPWNTDTYERIFEKTMRDLEPVVRRWGKEMVIAENPFPDPRCVGVNGNPNFVRGIIESLDIGFLLDVSHARLTARKFGMDEFDYLMQLPLKRTKEMHVTGIKKLEGELLENLMRNQPKSFDITDFIGKEMDHQNLSEDDFSFLKRVYKLIDKDILREPWVASLEHGGIGSFWELSMDEEVLAEQLPRLYNMTHSIKVKELV